MTLFSLDTSTRTGSMAIWRNGAAEGRAGDDPRSHAERLPLEAVVWLVDHGLTLSDIDAFVVVAGPGSFTGLRVGIAAAQGWAFATNRQIAAVPTLDALVTSLGPMPAGQIVVPCVDGLRGEIFYGVVLDGKQLFGPTVGLASDAIAAVQQAAGDAPVVIAGDGVAKYATAWAEAGWRTMTPAMTLAEAAVRIVAGGGVVAGPPHAARPQYVRKTDAEIMRERGGRRP